jgi:hypothetical protein
LNTDWEGTRFVPPTAPRAGAEETGTIPGCAGIRFALAVEGRGGAGCRTGTGGTGCRTVFAALHYKNEDDLKNKDD